MTTRDFCRERGFSVSSMYLWVSRLRSDGAQTNAVPSVRMARVVRTEAPRRDGRIVVACGRLRVHLAEDVSVDVLERVVGLLQRTRP